MKRWKESRLGRYLKLAISCALYAVSWPVLKAAEHLGLKRRTTLIILYYHNVSAANRTGFARQMDALARRAQVVHADWRGNPDSRQLCAITFDDAFVGVVENALPELARRNLPCTIFVPVGNLGRFPEWAMEVNVNSDDVVTDQQVISSLPSTLVKLGSHSVSHPYLSRIPREAARHELEQSRSMLRSVIGEDVRLVSFPYGDYDSEVVTLCQQAGYDLAYGIRPVPIDPRADEFVRGRVSIEPEDGELEFFLKMSGYYRWIPLASALKQAIKAPHHILRTHRRAPVVLPALIGSRMPRHAGNDSCESKRGDAGQATGAIEGKKQWGRE
jgi:peptidoglycan/xylan/chitin deacetylase (PgdA/CDA1 family)